VEQRSQKLGITPDDIERARGRPALSEEELIRAAIAWANSGRLGKLSSLLGGDTRLFPSIAVEGPYHEYEDINKVWIRAQWDTLSRIVARLRSQDDAVQRSQDTGLVVEVPSDFGGKRLAPTMELIEVEKIRKSFRSALVAVVEGRRRGIATELVREWRTLASELAFIPTAVGNGKFHYLATTHSGPLGLPILGHVLALLSDPDKQYRNKLCQCQLQSCGKFFPAEPGTKGRKSGRTRRKYCSTDHQNKALNEGKPERMRLLREKRKQDARTLQSKVRGARRLAASGR
jgi:predicted RNA-binding Zn ribbon-like protein